ncbi:sodium/proline symporter [Sinobacterium caligoides]|uniref:Sodium/proline symporter n=1 Tax=Sinobacterium caligoides TaxID=933926 RepID=A0A3N2DQ49_9GAMM|nr:sodium/proline symporter PutP [Sinobacterium caligoides]ROS01946.1 sodium/proline symporter [Sinobacterium caligoides]
MLASNAAVMLTFFAYLALMLAIGLFAYRRTATPSDYFLGGRALGPWSAALSAGASDMSGWLLLGLPGFAFVAGAESLWLAAGLLLGTYLNWTLVATRLRLYSISLDDALTLPEFLARRFADNSKLMQSISAFFILLFFLFYTSSGLVAGGKLFETVFGLDYNMAVIVGTACVISYTLLGGFLAVAWTDLVQGLLMAAALLIVPIAAMQVAGGGAQVLSDIEANNPQLLNLWTNAQGEALSWVAIASLLGWGLGYFGQPHILVRFAAIKNGAGVARARRIALLWTAACLLGALLVGFVGIVYVDQQLGGEIDDVERIFMLLVSALFHPVIAGILLAAILAAIMSTADSQLLVSSSALAEDFYCHLIKPGANSEEVVKVGRVAVVVLSLIALMLAMNPHSTVLGLVSYAWAGFGAAFGPVVLLSLYWRRMNRLGAVAGIVVGGLTVVFWKQGSGGIFELYEIVPGVVFATVAIVFGSLLGGRPSQSVRAKFDEVKGLLRLQADSVVDSQLG